MTSVRVCCAAMPVAAVLSAGFMSMTRDWLLAGSF
jgi:hypothetical protein